MTKGLDTAARDLVDPQFFATLEDLELIARTAVEGFLQGLHRMANRVAIGLVLASLIIGAALLSRVHTDVTIGGYPAIALIFFVLAALGGFWLVVTIAVSDRKIRRR